MDLDVLKVKFTHSNTVRDKKPYTIYEIEVRSSSTITWVIYKRYSSFHQLHQDLVKAPTISPEMKINLPQLPPKRLTRSLAVEFVEKRKNELQDYLRAMLETPGLVHSPVILSFLEVPDSVRPMLAAAMQHNQQAGFVNSQTGGMGGFDLGVKDYSDKDMSSSSGASSKLSYASKTPDERRILELINLLKFHPNKVTAIKNFEEWFFESRPRLSPEFSKLLLQGKSGSETDGGLIQTIGDISYSHVASRAALYLLCRLLDVEKNKDAHLFLEQFVNFDVLTLKKMQINQHIISERGNRIGAFKIIQILRNAPQAGASTPGRTDHQLEQIVNDSWALREYYKWSERKSDTSGQIVPFNHTTSQNKDNIYLKSLNLSSGTAAPAVAGGSGAPDGANAFVDTDVGQMRHLRARISDIFQDLKRLLEERETFVAGVDGQPLTHATANSPQLTAQQSRDGATGWRVVQLVTPFDANGRPIMSPADCYDEDISVLYKNARQDVVVVKMTCIVPYSMEEVAPYLADLRRRKEWDLKYHKGKCLEVRQSQEYAASTSGGHPISLQYPEYQTDIAHMVFKSFSSPYKYRDVVVVRCFAQIDKTRAEFEAQGFKSRQSVGVSSPPAAAGSDSELGATQTEDPIFKEGIFADGAMIFGSRSVIHVAGPEFKDNVRAVLYPTGYILTPLRDQGIDIHPTSGNGAPVYCDSFGSSCQLTFLTQMDRESVLIVSPDLLGETNELRQTYNNIKACLARDYGLRTLRASRHTAQVRHYAGRPDEEPLTSRASSVAPSPALNSYTPATYQHRNPADSIDSDASPLQRGVPAPGPLPVIPEKR